MDRGHVTAFRAALLFVLLLTSSARATEHDWPTPPRRQAAEPRFSFSLDNRTGLAEAPFVTTAFPEVSGFANVLTPAAAVHFATIGWLRARLPISAVRLDFPAGAQLGEAAIGNLELALEHGFEFHRSTRVGLLGAFLAPTANHGSEASLLNNRALALASALSGNKDSFLLTPGATGLRLGASIEHWHEPFQFRASVDVPVLIRISDASLPQETETHTLGLTPALELEAAWWVTQWFAASLGAGLVAEAVRLQEPARESDQNRRVQPRLNPGLNFRLGQRFSLALDVIVPVSGALGGQAWSLGLGGRLEL
jgi:hypothetical protein